MQRVFELIDATRLRYPKDRFFEGFNESCRLNPVKRRYYRTYDDALRTLNSASWEVLKQKALNHYLDHREGQQKQGFFNQLNEAFAYRYLVSRKCSAVTIMEETGETMPDIQFGEPRRQCYCEVKTIGLSDDEIERRSSLKAHKPAYEFLSTGFFNKFQDSIEVANQQISEKGDAGLVFLILNNDDIALDHYQQYRKQIISHCRENSIQNLYVKIGLRGQRRIHITRRYTDTLMS